eukprot:SAG11_NODE_28422_length_321_cov_13.819820_2_plen_28_part_01
MYADDDQLMTILFAYAVSLRGRNFTSMF